MNNLIGITILVILTLLVIRQIKVWKLRVFLSPGFYFGFLWMLGVVGIMIFANAELIPLAAPEHINELMSFIGFTGLCFLILTKKGYSTINHEAVSVEYTSWKIYKVLSILLISVAIFEFVRLGANFNMGNMRAMIHETVANRSILVSYVEVVAIAISIWAGYKAMKLIVLGGKQHILTILFLVLPLLSNLIFSMSKGGRVDFVYCFSYYLIGAVLSLPINKKLSNLKKPIIVISLSAVIIMAFISGVASQRAENSTGKLSDKEIFFEENYGGFLSVLYGPIEYMTESFIGYQYRRDDAVDLTQLGYGRYTLNGFINWTLPFAGQFGLGDASIAKALDIYYDSQETYDFHRIAYFVVHSCYIPIVKDFGPRGAYVFIFILVYIAHWLFVRIQQRKRIVYSTTFYLYFLFWEYWVKSNYYGTLSQSVLLPLYGFLIVDILNYCFTPRRQNTFTRMLGSNK